MTAFQTGCQASVQKQTGSVGGGGKGGEEVEEVTRKLKSVLSQESKY